MKRIFYGWWIVLAVSLINLWGAGTFYYSFTAFFNPIVEEFGWSYAATSFAASLRSIEGGIASPLVGLAVDRFGARKIIFLGSLLSGLGFVLLSRMNSLISFYILFIFLSIGASLFFPIPGWAAITNWFAMKRGRVLGIVSAAIGMAGIIIYLVNWLIGLYGWRMTLVILGIGMWVIGIPSSLIVRHSPEPYSLYPDGKQLLKSPGDKIQSTNQIEENRSKDYSVKEAMKTNIFWILTLAVTISSATLNAVIVHIMPYLISIDFSRQISSLIASLLIFISIIGRFGFGWFTNSMKSKYLLSIGLAMHVLGLLFLGFIETLWHGVFFIILFGIGFGGIITLRLTIQAEYFGRKAFGAIQGVIMAIAVIGSLSSPLLTGLFYDLYGNYRSAWFIMAGVNLVVIPLILKFDRSR